MDFVKCPMCGREKISKNAPFCPECGEPMVQELPEEHVEELQIEQEVPPISNDVVENITPPPKAKFDKTPLIITFGLMLCILIYQGAIWGITQSHINLIRTAYENKEFAKVIQLYETYNDEELEKRIPSMLETAKSEIIFDNQFKLASEYYSKKEFAKAYSNIITIEYTYSNYKDVEKLISEIKPLLASEYLNSAKKAYKLKDYLKAKTDISYSLELFESAEAKSLKSKYDSSYNQYHEIQAKEEEKQRIIDEKKSNLDRMNRFEGDGIVSIAVGKATLKHSTGSHVANGNGTFVYVSAHALNQSNDVIHVNPNDFTLSDSNGNTVSHDSDTYGLSNYFDAVNLNPNNQTSGWLIFYLAKDTKYTLYYHSLSGDLAKEIYIY